MLAIVPVNSPSSGKQRLRSLLSAPLRAELVQAMLADVLDACKQARSVDRIVVVTPERALAPDDVEVLTDAGRGHAAAIAAALAWSGNEDALVVMADCPLVRPGTIDLLFDCARPVALAPAQDGGTNALVLRPADAIEPAFGVRRGAAVLAKRAERLGVELAIVHDPLLALDVDRPEDVERVLDLGQGTRTHALLSRELDASAEFRRKSA